MLPRVLSQNTTHHPVPMNLGCLSCNSNTPTYMQDNAKSQPKCQQRTAKPRRQNQASLLRARLKQQRARPYQRCVCQAGVPDGSSSADRNSRADGVWLLPCRRHARFCSSSGALPTAACCRKDELGLTGGAAFVLGFGSLSQGRGLWPGCECTSQSLDHEAKQRNGFLELFRVGS